MLIRMRFLRACQGLLLSGLFLAAGQAISAQSIGQTPSQAPAAAPSQPSQPASPQIPRAAQPARTPGDTSAKPQPPPEPLIKLAGIVQMVENEGRSTSISSYVAEGIGIKATQIDSSPVQARAMSDTQREFYVIDDTGALLFLMKNGNNTFVYLANNAGVLQMAGYFYPGHFHSQEFKRVSKETAAAGLTAEKEFWTKKIFPPKDGDTVKHGEPVSKSDYARSEAGAREKSEFDRKATREPSALKTTADVDEKDKLSHMSPKERIQYLDRQMREAKQEAKLEKKESAKEKKLANKIAVHKPTEAKDDKTAEKNPQDSPAKSTQQSNTDGDATPSKKKISWF